MISFLLTLKMPDTNKPVTSLAKSWWILWVWYQLYILFCPFKVKVILMFHLIMTSHITTQENSHLVFYIVPQCCFFIWHCCHVASRTVVKVGVVWLIWAICRLSKISCSIVHLITKLLRIGRIVGHLLVALSCKEFKSIVRPNNRPSSKRKENSSSFFPCFQNSYRLYQ